MIPAHPGPDLWATLLFILCKTGREASRPSVGSIASEDKPVRPRAQEPQSRDLPKENQLVWSGVPLIFTVQDLVCLDAYRVLTALATHSGIGAV